MTTIATLAPVPFVEARGVAIVFPEGTQALDGLDLALAGGGFVSVVGCEFLLIS